MTAPLTALASALGGRLVDHDGDQRVHVDRDVVYAAPTGAVKLDHRGHITKIGRWDDETDVLVAAYREVVAP